MWKSDETQGFQPSHFLGATRLPYFQTHPDSVQRQICEKPVVLSVTLPQHPLATDTILKNVLTKSRSQGALRYDKPW